MNLMPRGMLIVAVGLAITLQTSWMSALCFAAQNTIQSPSFSIEELDHEIAVRRKRVDEFNFIKKEASKLGVRAWLFGGGAAGYGHYVKLDKQREKGDTHFQKNRFDYDYSNIYRSTQDLDIVIDGNAEQAQKLQSALTKKYPHLQGSRTAWEVRLLTQDMGDKQAILNNPDFMNQHTDSNSTGMIELTEPKSGESVVRDVRDWHSKEPNFLKDLHDDALHLYFSPTHETTKFFKEGRNPPIIFVIRSLTKAFQYELKLRPDDLARIKQIIDEFDPKRDIQNAYVSNWIEMNGKKLFKNAVNIEYAWNTLEQLGLRKKLIAIRSNANVGDSLSSWMSKEPLRSKPIGQGSGKTARELGLDTVAHVTNSFPAYESITYAHTGDANVTISRAGARGEEAYQGDGFYTKIGRKGTRDTGLTIRFHLNPDAREGSDFTLWEGKFVIVHNKAALSVIPETLNVGPLEYLRILEQQKDFDKSDLGIMERLKRRVSNKLGALRKAQEDEIVTFMKEAFKRPGDVSAPLIDGWLSLSISRKHPEIINALLDKAVSNKEVALHLLDKQEFRHQPEWIGKMLNQPWVDHDVLTALTLSDLRFSDHPDWVDHLLTHGALDKDIVNYILPRVRWQEHPEWIEKLLERGNADRLMAEKILSRPEAKEHLDWIKKLIEKGTADKEIASHVLHQELWVDHPEFIDTLIKRGNADLELISLVLTKEHWRDHPEWVEALLKKESNHKAIAFYLLSNPISKDHPEWVEAIVRAGTANENIAQYVLPMEHWKNNSELRRKVGGVEPTYENLRTAFAADGGIKQKAHTIEELLDEQVNAGKVSSGQAGELMKFVHSVESNHYDKSVSTFNDPNKSFINYFGREVETQEMVDAVSRLEKGHVLLTGKAGTGKTTILKILSDLFVQGKQSIHDEKPPIILELPITTVTNPNDPTEPKKAVANAKALSKALGRRVILYVDEAHISTPMTRNALKGYLTEMEHAIGDDPAVNMVWSTTSSEARDFFKDSAFSRRFTQVHVSEFNRDDTIKLIKQSSVPAWKKVHTKKGATFDGINDDAFDYAYRFAGLEQAHAGNPTGTKELLEGALTRKMNRLAQYGTKGPFILTADDVRDYIASKLKTPLIPGDPEFTQKFEKMWGGFREDYVGNDGAMSTVKKILKDHFSSVHKNKMTAVVAFGPPGGGKTYSAESIAKHFFKGAILTVNGAEYKNGGLELNKLLGSPVGTVGSNEQLSILTKFIQENPGGGVIKIEEADYLHKDVIQLLTNIITDKKFTDGLGKEYDMSRFVFWQNTNIGQDRMIPTDAANKMNWEQYQTRRTNLTEKTIVDGKPVERIKETELSGLFDQYMTEISTKSNPSEDTSSVSQEANKQKRRYKGIYILPPTREELIDSAHRRVQKFIRDAKTDYGVNFEISPQSVEKALNVEHFKFEEGYSYGENQLQDKLFSPLSAYFHERGKTIKAHIEDTHIELDDHKVPAQDLIVQTSDGKSEKFGLGATIHEEKNPWGSNPETMKRIQNFPEEMAKYVKGNHDILTDMAAVLKSKAVDWNDKAVFTLLGTSGNGKTETFKALAKVLFGDEKALFKITEVNHPWDLNDYLRPPTGVEGGNKETDFERWFKSRKSAGGGVILFDELMSEIGKGADQSVGGQKGGKMAVLQKLYELLDEQKIKIAGRYEDARGFIIGITGNSLQELFANLDDNPETEALVKKIREKLTRSEIVKNLESLGIDAPKIARLGHVYVMGPQPRDVSMGVGKVKIRNAVEAIKKATNNAALEIVIPEQATEAVVNRLSTVKLGMREVDEGFQTLLFRPLKTLISDMSRAKGIKLKKIEMKLPDGEHPQWLVNGEEVRLEGHKLADGREKPEWEFKKNIKPDSVNRTPSVHDLKSVEKMKVTPELLDEIGRHEYFGHWMTNAMLNRQNGADFVSLIPGPGYLGYVRPAAQEVADVENLSSILKRMVELSAGHRAVFYHGSYATGGGNDGSSRTAGKPATDDLGKIEKLKNTLINNGMFPGVRESSSAEEKAFAGRLIDEIVDRMADEVIHKGVASKQFQTGFDQLMKQRYMAKEELDKLLKEVDFEKFGYHGKDALFMETLSASIAKELEIRKVAISKGSEGAQAQAEALYERTKSLSNGLLSRTFKESEVRAHGDVKALAELTEIKNAVIDTVKNGTPHPRMQIKCVTQQLEEMLF